MKGIEKICIYKIYSLRCKVGRLEFYLKHKMKLSISLRNLKVIKKGITELVE